MNSIFSKMKQSCICCYWNQNSRFLWWVFNFTESCSSVLVILKSLKLIWWICLTLHHLAFWFNFSSKWSAGRNLVFIKLWALGQLPLIILIFNNDLASLLKRFNSWVAFSGAVFIVLVTLLQVESKRKFNNESQ